MMMHFQSASMNELMMMARCNEKQIICFVRSTPNYELTGIYCNKKCFHGNWCLEFLPVHVRSLLVNIDRCE